ncbi:MAG: hypothetical protein ACOC3T_03390 [Bacteroidota bacterium]
MSQRNPDIKKMNKVVFAVESKVIRDTLEYVFIGKEKYQLRLLPGLTQGIPFVGASVSLLVCECPNLDQEKMQGLFAKLNSLRKQLDKNIPLILFSENPDVLKGKIDSTNGNVRLVTLDHFFLDNLFHVMQEELCTDNICCSL